MNKLKKVLTVVVVVGFSFFVSFSNVLAARTEAGILNGGSGGVAGGGDHGCGVEIPSEIVSLTSTVVNLIKIVVPIILIILGMLDMGKAVASQKEDEIKKGQKTLMSRCIAAGIVFFVVAIVQLLMNIIAPEGKDNLVSCINYIVNGK